MKERSVTPQASNYSMKHVETVVDGTDVRVRLFTLAGGEIIPWHYHSHCTDYYFVLEGAHFPCRRARAFDWMKVER